MHLIVVLLVCFFWIQSSMAVVDVITPVPAPPNTFFPEKAVHVPVDQKGNPLPEILPPLAKGATNKDYLESLFNEVEVAKTTPPPLSDIKLYDKLEGESIAYGVLKENPNLRVGTMSFRPLSHNAQHAREIRKGQELLTQDFGNKPYTYKEITDSISRQVADPKSSISDIDWILMANAFRTLKAPGDSTQAHVLGDLLSEYVLLQEINKLEHKEPLSHQDRSILSTLHYDLAQLYQSMIKNDEGRFKRSPQGYYTFPIDEVYFGNEPGLDYPVKYVVPFDSLVATRLDLLENALLFDPDDDAWAELIEFAAFDLVNPWFYDELTPAFWADYFPFGLSRDHVERLRHRWNEIRHNRDVRENHNLRLNQIGGERALRRLSVVHAKPTSRFNQAVNKNLGRTPRSNERIRSSMERAARSTVGTSSGTAHMRHTPTIVPSRSLQQFIPHHATTQRPSIGNIYRDQRSTFSAPSRAPALQASASAPHGRGNVAHGGGNSSFHKNAGSGSHLGGSAPTGKKKP